MNRVCRHFEEAGFTFKTNLDLDKAYTIAIRFTNDMTRTEKNNLCKSTIDAVRNTIGESGYFTLTLHDFTPTSQIIMVKVK
jgi:C4-type Zn-finger protein